MLDPRIYRAAFVPTLLMIIVAAFSLRGLPRPVESTLAPDAFIGVRAAEELEGLADAFPDRRPGGAGDRALAARIAHELGVVLNIPVRVRHTRADTIDGTRDLTTVIATRPGTRGPGLVVLSHRDAAAPGAKAELAGTAAMLELARVVADGRLTHTITFVSTSGGSGGAAGAADVADHLPQPVNAVLVLGGMGSGAPSKALTAYSNGFGQAPLRLQRSVAAAIREQTGREPALPAALTQWARLAFPLTVGEQGELDRRGLPAVLVQGGGERPPGPADDVGVGRLGALGRATLASVYALDGARPVAHEASEAVVIQRKVLPQWAVRLMVLALLAPALLASIDGFARVRRRRQAVLVWLPWLLSAAAPFAAAAFLTRLLVWTGLVDAPGGPVPAGALSIGGAQVAGLVAVTLVFALGWLLRAPVLRRLTPPDVAGSQGAAAALALTVCGLAFVLWVVNPYAAAFLVLPANLWLFALEPRMPRSAGLAAIAAGLLPVGLVALGDAAALGLDPVQLVWFGVLLVGGGHFGVGTWMLWSLIAGCAVCASAVVLRSRPVRSNAAPITPRPLGLMTSPLFPARTNSVVRQ